MRARDKRIGPRASPNSRVTQGPSGTWPLFTMESPPVMSAKSCRITSVLASVGRRDDMAATS